MSAWILPAPSPKPRLGAGGNEQPAVVNALVAAGTSAVATFVADLVGHKHLASVATLNRNLGAMPVLLGNRVDLYTDYRESIEAMTAEVERATKWVHVEFYITAWDSVTAPFYDALTRAAARGVVVRLLFDHFGSHSVPGYKQFKQRLARSGIAWHPMLTINPFKGQWRRPDLRNHRKILVVDGRVAFTGSQNLIEPGYDKPKNHRTGREYVELMARVEGPVVVALNLVFATDWHSETGIELTDELQAPTPVAGSVAAQVIPSGPGAATENNLRAFTTLLYSAQRRLSITSPYFVPDESLLYAVTTAAHRGVEVELFVSEARDQFMVFHAQRSYYEALLRAGVRIYLYPAPYVLHSKFFTADDDVAVLGSSNLDKRSFSLNHEVSLMLPDRDVVARLRKVEDSYRQWSRELTLDEWLSRSRGSSYTDSVMRLTAAFQ
jgi:cardiolipin synthase A/B